MSKKTICMTLAAGLAICLVPSLVMAAEEAGHSEMGMAAAGEGSHGAHGGGGDINPVAFQWVPAVASLVIFGIAFGILARVVWPKLLAGLDEREKKIRDEIFAAEEARKKADDALKDYERELAGARAEAQKMIEQTKAEQARMAADLRAKADAELTQMRESAMQSIDAAKRAAINEIYSEAANLATTVAAKILQREISATDQQRLVDESVEQFTRMYAETH